MIEVWSKPSCVQCDATKRELRKRGLEFLELDLMDNPAQLAEFKAAGHLSAPVVVVSDGPITITVWSGFRAEKIAALAAEQEKAA